MEAVKTSTESAVPAANRPPQSFPALTTCAPLPIFDFEFPIEVVPLNLLSLIPNPSTLTSGQAPQSEPQGVQPNKAVSVALVIDIVFLKGRNLGIIERRIGLPSRDYDVTLIKLEPHAPAYIRLRGIDGFLQDLALRCKPITVVDHLGIALDQGIPETQHFAVHGDGLQRAVRRVKDRSPRRLIDTPRLHSHVSVLDHVHTANAMLCSKVVEFSQKLSRR